MLNRILIIQTASLGDVILSTSLAETLHKNFPSARIDFLIKAGYEGLFEGHPFVHTVHVWDKANRKYRNLLRLIWKVRATKYDAVINVQRFLSSGLVAALSGAKFRSGFVKNPLSFTFTHKTQHIILDKGDSPHEIERNVALIQPLYKGPPSLPCLYPSINDFEFIERWKSGEYITISPASLYFTKQLPAHKWVELILNMPARRVLLLGSKADKILCNKIMADCNGKDVINLAGELSFLQSAALMKDALMNYVNDSAPLHLTTAVNAPVAAVFCSTVPSFGFTPLSDNTTIIETKVPLPCKPCGLHGYNECPEKHFKCAETISLTQLLLPLTYGKRAQS